MAQAVLLDQHHRELHLLQVQGPGRGGHPVSVAGDACRHGLARQRLHGCAVEELKVLRRIAQHSVVGILLHQALVPAAQRLQPVHQRLGRAVVRSRHGEDRRPIVDAVGIEPQQIDGLVQQAQAVVVGNLAIGVAASVEVTHRGTAHQAVALLVERGVYAQLGQANRDGGTRNPPADDGNPQTTSVGAHRNIDLRRTSVPRVGGGRLQKTYLLPKMITLSKVPFFIPLNLRSWTLNFFSLLILSIVDFFAAGGIASMTSFGYALGEYE